MRSNCSRTVVTSWFMITDSFIEFIEKDLFDVLYPISYCYLQLSNAGDSVNVNGEDIILE